MDKFWEYIRGMVKGTVIFNPVIFLQIMKDAGINIPNIPDENDLENVDNVK